MSDSEESSSSSGPIVGNYNPFVFDVHELSKDDQVSANPIENKIKKLKKKKELPNKTIDTSNTSISSESISELSSLSPTIDEIGGEEFYDAHDSYHTMQCKFELNESTL